MKRGPQFHDPDQAPLPLQFQRLVSCAAGRASGHIMRKPGGMLTLRVTVTNRNPKHVGVRIKVSLRTRDIAEAALRRDVILCALRKAGVLSARLKEGEAMNKSCTATLGPIDELSVNFQPEIFSQSQAKIPSL